MISLWNPSKTSQAEFEQGFPAIKLTHICGRLITKTSCRISTPLAL